MTKMEAQAGQANASKQDENELEAYLLLMYARFLACESPPYRSIQSILSLASILAPACRILHSLLVDLSLPRASRASSSTASCLPLAIPPTHPIPSRSYLSFTNRSSRMLI